MNSNRIWELLTRKLAGEASPEDIRELDELLKKDMEMDYQVHLYTSYYQHPEPQAIPDSIKNSARLRLRQQLAQEEATTDVHPGKKAHILSFFTRPLVAAASIVLLLVVGVLVYLSINSVSNDRKMEFAVNEFKTTAGTRSKTILPDGSVVWLNSESTISYNNDFGLKKRDVRLSGEAFFDVVHNAEIPFVVHAQNVKILVKGTAFNVRSYPGSNKVQTSLIRGSVQVSSEADPKKLILLKPNEKITMLTKEESPILLRDHAGKGDSSLFLPYRLDTLKLNKYAQVFPEISWMHDQLVFDNEPFGDVLEKLEKWYNVKIILMNEGLRTKAFSGVFENENVNDALSFLQFVHHFDYEIAGRNIIIK